MLGIYEVIIHRSVDDWSSGLEVAGQILHAMSDLSKQTCQVSRISRETHAFLMSLTLSLRTVEISRIFLLNEKQYFNVTSVLI